MPSSVKKRIVLRRVRLLDRSNETADAEDESASDPQLSHAGAKNEMQNAPLGRRGRTTDVTR
jgi:hypothetical protein